MNPKLKEALQKGKTSPPGTQDQAKPVFELTDEEIDLVGGGETAGSNCCLGIRGNQV